MLALLLLILILQQPSPKATIEGRVTAAETGAPLKNARVRLSGGPNYDREVRTDDTGSFVIPDVEPESYHIGWIKMATLHRRIGRPVRTFRVIFL